MQLESSADSACRT